MLFDEDLARMFGISTKALAQAVRRNAARFPCEFVFRLSPPEFDDLKAQSISSGWCARRVPPLAFTESGVLMAAAVLRSRQAAEMSVFIVRAFVRLRSVYATRLELTRRLDEIDAKTSLHSAELRPIVEAIRQLALSNRVKRHPAGSPTRGGTADGV